MSYRPGEKIGGQEVYSSRDEYRYYERRGYVNNPHDGSGIIDNTQPEPSKEDEEKETADQTATDQAS
jgi:hypothetical protein